MKYIIIILSIFLFECVSAQAIKIRKTADNSNGGIRTFTWEIYDAADPETVLQSGTESHTATMATNDIVRGLCNDILEEYLKANNIIINGTGEWQSKVMVLASNQSTGANTNPVGLPGLSFRYDANSVYRITFMGKVQPSAATAGCGFQFDLSTAVNSIDISFYHQLANTGTLTGGHSIADDASVGVSSGFPGTSTYTVTGSGLIRSSVAGIAQFRFRSETTSVVTAIAGFTLIIEKIQ